MFQYTTIYRLRQEGFGETDYPDALLVRKIEEASQILTDALEQWFTPVRSRRYIDGSGDSIVWLPNKVPILEVLELAQVDSASISGRDQVSKIDLVLDEGYCDVFAPDDYYVKGRVVELRFTNFYPGRGNVVLGSYSGFLDSFETGSRETTLKKVLTTTAANALQDAVEITLSSVVGLKLRDVLVFESNDSARTVLGMTIINTITRSTQKVGIDKLQPIDGVTIPSGSRVVSFGAVPILIERAVIALIKKMAKGIGTEEYDESVFHAKIKGEKTDRYSYDLWGKGEGGGIGITGDPLIDDLLSTYASPGTRVDII